MDEKLVGIGEKIRYHRKRTNWSQEKLALEAGVNSGFLGCIERGEKNPTMQTLEKLASALSISVARLCAEIDDGDTYDVDIYLEQFEALIREVPAQLRSNVMGLVESAVKLVIEK